MTSAVSLPAANPLLAPQGSGAGHLFWGLRIDRPLPHHDAGVGEPPPGAGVGLVVLVRDHDLVALAPQ
ncbi:MAG: hypothetical protein GY719_13970 [bacterium]|nr:hypothetical protein [bacterium]